MDSFITLLLTKLSILNYTQPEVITVPGDLKVADVIRSFQLRNTHSLNYCEIKSEAYIMGLSTIEIGKLSVFPN